MDRKRIEKLNNLFINSLKQRVFPCAAMAFSKYTEKGYERFENYYDLTQLDSSKKPPQKNQIFDLASLTKPLATVPLLLALFDKHILKPETELGSILENCAEDKKKITIKQLMSHSAGFAPHRKFFKNLLNISPQNRKVLLLQVLMEEKLTFKPGKKHCYSDLGFMLLGLIIEKITGKEIGDLAYVTLYKPLELQKELYFPGLKKKKDHTYVSTEKCIWDKKMLNGLVHDDNCRVLGGQMGHAGLFGTVKGVMAFCENLLDQWQDRGQHPAYSNDLLINTLKRVGNSRWTMGFDMVSETGSSSGSHFSKKSVGHLGFTGTSFWIDPESNCIAVLLTNRVYYGRENWKIREFRPAFHDLLMGNNV